MGSQVCRVGEHLAVVCQGERPCLEVPYQEVVPFLVVHLGSHHILPARHTAQVLGRTDCTLRRKDGVVRRAAQVQLLG